MSYRRLLRAALGYLVIILTAIAILGQTTGSIAGRVKDPTGAVVPNAQVALRSSGGETRSTTTDARGQFRIDNIAPGSYRLSISRSGFKIAEQSVEVSNRRNATLDINLALEPITAEVDVSSKGGIRANSDPVYHHLRQDAGFETYSVNNLTITRDVGTLTLKSGRLSFRNPIEGHFVNAVFIGDGEFTLEPVLGIERDYLRFVTAKDDVVETFDKFVLCFTDTTYDEIKKQATAAEPDNRAADVFQDFHKRVRSRSDRPRSVVESLFASEGIENLDAETLANIYNPTRPGFFMAFINGKPFGDLRYIVRSRGAIPQILSPEEVGLINYDPLGEREGILYLSHFQKELQARQASSEEDKRIIDVQHYRIETVIDGEKLIATAEIEFTAMADGDRVLNFGLLPSLRVNRVTFGNTEIQYVQEARKEDGAFYAILPERLVKGKSYKINIDYDGNKVLEDQGGGNFAVGARTSWYPSVNAFNDRATFDLTFKVPKQYTVVAVGKEVKTWQEGNFAASQWVSEIPLAVAGFNYGRFKKKALVDEPTKYEIEGYATSELPGYLKAAGDRIGAMTPTRLTDEAINEAQNSMRIFTAWFGEAPYGRVAVTQQPQFNFGQSWPTLVYLPIISFFDGTQRWMLLGQNSTQLNEFIDEVTPHEISHQWWGHILGWASYHDQWLSEGFAYFSAGLYLQMTEQKPDKYMQYWQHAAEQVLEKNRFGQRANDAGPIWMGLRLNTYRTPDAYNRVEYRKGGYILHMLRRIMWDSKTHDDNFIAMMKDFVKTYTNRNASTEGFQAIVEKHMTPAMDLDGDHRMNWFFNEWVYGTEIPRYRLQYSITPEKDGMFLLKGALTQSDVTDQFKMIIPIYVDIDGKIGSLGSAALQGNRTNEFQVRLQQKPKRVLINAYHDVLATESISEQK
jgi:hypothetical protein